MLAMNLCLRLAMGLLCLSPASCMVGHPGSSQKQDFRITGRSETLSEHDFDRIGFSISLPSRPKFVRHHVGSRYQREKGRKSLKFDLVVLESPKRVFPGFESRGLAWIEAHLFSSKENRAYEAELAENTAVWDSVGVWERPVRIKNKFTEIQTPVPNGFGMKQRLYRMDLENPQDGSILRVSLVSAVLGNGNEAIPHGQARKILESIRWL